MAFRHFRRGIAWRSVVLFLTLTLGAGLILGTRWYLTIGLVAALAILQLLLLMRFTSQSSREVARFLDAIAFEDFSQSFAGLSRDGAHGELGAAMTRVVELLRTSRSEREEQARYLQSLIAQVPVALISVDEKGGVQLLNMAARRLFGASVTERVQFVQYGDTFAVGLEALRPGTSAILKVERPSGALQLKASATDVTLGGVRRRLISLQNIENELSAREVAAWQTVIRVMAHEIMNSLTPLSSLSATARDIVRDVRLQLPEDDPRHGALGDASEALETVARRSEGLLHFVQNHRRLTKPLAARMELTSVRRVFARIHRLMASEVAARGIEWTLVVEPETLEVAADPDLLDQALINLIRNAIEALRDQPAGLIELSARRHPDGRIVLSVADNGPGISVDLHDKIFVPFFTTKRQGSGVGLTLVRQIATAHGASVDVTQTPGGGATVSLRF